MNRRTLLVTAFEPFDRYQYNTSAEILDSLPERLGGWAVVKRMLPVVWGGAGDALESALEEVEPAVCVALGMAPGKELRLERLAVNFRAQGKSDNAGASPGVEAVVAGAPPAYYSGLPLDELLEALRRAGFEASISGSAGDYLCNEVYFRLMHRVAREERPALAGFVHVPVREDDGGAPVERSGAAVRALLGVLLEQREGEGA